MKFFSKGERLEASCSIALLEGAQNNGELILTNSTDHEQETIANMRKDRNEARQKQDRAR